jgi:hypothetical protein
MSSKLLKISVLVLLSMVFLPLVEWVYFANGERKKRALILALSLPVLISVIILFLWSD